MVHFLSESLIVSPLAHFGHGGYLGHVTWIIYIHIGYPFLLMHYIKFGFDWSSGFRGADV